MAASDQVVIRYTNWRGETTNRRILPRTLRFAATAWHPEPQWLLDAWDLDRKVERSFALANILEWHCCETDDAPTPTTPTATDA